VSGINAEVIPTELRRAHPIGRATKSLAAQITATITDQGFSAEHTIRRWKKTASRTAELGANCRS
jgi:hypothetical protein